MKSVPSRHVVTFCVCLFVISTARDGFSQDLNLTARIQAPGVELTTGSEFDASVRLDARIDGVQGWSFGIGHEATALELLAAEIGSTTETINDGQPPQFLRITTEFEEGVGVTMAVVNCFGCPATLDTGDDYELLKMRYRVVVNPAAVDPCEPVETSIAFVDSLGNPPVDNVFTVAGTSEPAEFVDGQVTVRCPGTLEVTRCEGDTENVYLEWTFGGEPEWGFLALYRDGELLELLAPDATSYTDEGLEPGDYQYTLATIVIEDPTNPTLIFFDCTATVIAITVTGVDPAVGNWLGGDELTVTGTAFTTDAPMSARLIAEGEEPLVLEVLEVVSETEMRVSTPEAPRLGKYGIQVESEKGSAELADVFEYGFVRGDANSDTLIDVSDGVYIFRFLFEGDVPVPPCRDSADTNDDGRIDIADGINVLDSIFIPEDLPPPFAEPGQDPTDDDLGCIEEIMS